MRWDLGGSGENNDEIDVGYCSTYIKTLTRDGTQRNVYLSNDNRRFAEGEVPPWMRYNRRMAGKPTQRGVASVHDDIQYQDTWTTVLQRLAKK